MNVQFDWHVGTEDEQLETLAQLGHKSPQSRHWWRWATIALVLLSIVAGGYLFLRRRYDEALQAAEFQIQGVIDLEARAYAQRDQDLFLEQQDMEASAWYRYQQERMSAACLRGGAALPSMERTQDDLSYFDCRPVLSATIDELELRGDIAWVQVVEGQPAVRRVRFYRRTDNGWKHTEPRDEFWGVAIQLAYGDLVFRYHRRDQPYVDDLVEQIHSRYQGLCTQFRCPTERPIEFNFAIDIPPGRHLTMRDGVFLLPSPWLSGLPVDDGWDPDYLLQLDYSVTYETMALYFRALSGGDLTPLHRALAVEYAAWQSTKDPSQAPLLWELTKNSRGRRAPDILASVEYLDSLSLLISNWLDLSPLQEPAAYFEFLLNVERDAALVGRESTFLLLQDDSRMAWLTIQKSRFNFAQARRDDWPPIQVEDVGFSGDLARVTIVHSSAQSNRDEIVFFRRLNGDWKHTAPSRVLSLGTEDTFALATTADALSSKSPPRA